MIKYENEYYKSREIYILFQINPVIRGLSILSIISLIFLEDFFKALY